MELHQLIEQFNSGGVSEKTASAASASDKKAGATDDLKSALQDALGAGEQKKEAAAAGNPIDDLMKLAEELSGMDKEADVAHAKLCGAAFADSAAQRWHQLKLAMEQNGHANTQTSLGEAMKAAALQGYQQTSGLLGKAASAEPEVDLETLVKAAEAGHPGAQEYLEKLSAEYVDGQMIALDDIHATAANEFLKGAAEVRVLVESVAR
jgi:hypothetical protein